MGRITQEAHQRQRMMKYRRDHTLKETAIRYGVSRKTVVKWWNRWDGTAGSLENRSRRPHRSPRELSEAMLRKIRHVLKKHRWSDVLLSYQEMRDRHGYQGSYGSVKRYVAIKKEEMKKYRESFLPLAHPPGHAQVDFGKFKYYDGLGFDHEGHALIVSFPYSNTGWMPLSPLRMPLRRGITQLLTSAVRFSLSLRSS